jgi:hypothetical protein
MFRRGGVCAGDRTGRSRGDACDQQAEFGRTVGDRRNTSQIMSEWVAWVVRIIAAMVVALIVMMGMVMMEVLHHVSGGEIVGDISLDLDCMLNRGRRSTVQCRQAVPTGKGTEARDQTVLSS